MTDKSKMTVQFYSRKDNMPNPQKTFNPPPYEVDFEWVAVYNDKTELKQNFGKGEPEEHHFGHIDLNNLDLFQLEYIDGSRPFAVSVKGQYIEIFGKRFYIEFPRDSAGQIVKGKLVYFRRVRNDFTPDRGIIITVKHRIGLQAKIDGINKQQFIFINSDGSFTLSQQK